MQLTKLRHHATELMRIGAGVLLKESGEISLRREPQFVRNFGQLRILPAQGTYRFFDTNGVVKKPRRYAGATPE